MRRLLYWGLLIFLLFAPMIVESVFISDILPPAQRLFPIWKNRPAPVLLSDILFIEGGVLLVFGALVAGVTLYSAWAALDVRQMQFTEYIWNWRRMREERNSPAGVIVGLTMLAAGIVYILTAVVIAH